MGSTPIISTNLAAVAAWAWVVKSGPVVELVYTQHLKCCAQKACGFDSHLDHVVKKYAGIV